MIDAKSRAGAGGEEFGGRDCDSGVHLWEHHLYPLVDLNLELDRVKVKPISMQTFESAEALVMTIVLAKEQQRRKKEIIAIKQRSSTCLAFFGERLGNICRQMRGRGRQCYSRR